MNAELTEKWRRASVAARKSEHHWPADCLAEAAEVVTRLTARLEFSEQTTTNVMDALAASGAETYAAEQTIAAVTAATDDAARHLGHAHPVVLALRAALAGGAR